MRPDHPGVLEELRNEEKVNYASGGEGPDDPDMGTQEDVGYNRDDDQLSHSHCVADEHRALEKPRFRCEAVTTDRAGVSHRYEAVKHLPTQTGRAPLSEDGPQETGGDHPGPGPA